MASKQSFYALLQYSPVPERYEFVNVGVALFVPERKYVEVKLSRTHKRIEKLFGRQPRGFLDALKAGLARRIKTDFAEDFDCRRFEAFATTRANEMRITKPLPIVVADPRADLEELFQQLVGEEEPARRLPRIQFELKKKFERAGVAKFLQVKPRPVHLPQGVTIEVPYAYRNGAFNLIDPVRLGGDASEALGQASKRAIESQWLREYSLRQENPKVLVVVGDFSGQRTPFVDAVKQLMMERDVKFYDMRGLEPLLEDIRKNAEQQSLSEDG